MKLGRDGIAGLIGLAISLLLLPQAIGLPRLPIVPIGPGFYPTLVLTFLAVTCALLVIQDAIAQRRGVATAPQTTPAESQRAYGLVLGSFVAVAGYITLLPLLGFRLATVLFVAAFQLILERPTTPRRWVALVAIAIGTSAVTYFAFERYLTVLLPRGAWTGW